MIGAGTNRTLPLLAAALLAAVGVGLIAVAVFRPENAPQDDPCAEPLVVYALDATPIEVVVRRCAARRGGSPGLLVATRDPAHAAAWRDALATWADDGRTTWFVVPVDDGPPARAAIDAVLGELAAELHVDAGRVALLVDAGLAAGAGIDAPPEPAAALVVHEAAPAVPGARAPDGTGADAGTAGGAPGPARLKGLEGDTLRVEGPVRGAAADVHAFLAERLAVLPLARPSADAAADGTAPRR